MRAPRRTRRTSSLKQEDAAVDELHLQCRSRRVWCDLSRWRRLVAARLVHVGCTSVPGTSHLTSPSCALLLEDADELGPIDSALAPGPRHRREVGKRVLRMQRVAPAAVEVSPKHLGRTATHRLVRCGHHPVVLDKTHVNWSPDSMCTSSAATAESTPRTAHRGRARLLKWL